MQAPERISRWFLVAVALGAGLLNATKPIHIDDPLYLAIARQIVAEPTNPFGGSFNWQGTEAATWQVSISPPLLSYYYAVWLYAAESFGWHEEWVIGLAMLPWSVLAGLALAGLTRTAGLGGSFDQATNTHEPWAGTLAMALVLAGPVFVVGMNRMLDVPTLALACSCLVCLETYRRHCRIRHLLLATLAGCLAVWTKYIAVTLVPVLLVAALAWRRWAILAPAVGISLAFWIWQSTAAGLYGESQVSAGLGFLSRFHAHRLVAWLEGIATVSAQMAMVFPVWIIALALGHRRRLSAAIAIPLVLLTAAWLRIRVPDAPWVAFSLAAGLGYFGWIEPLARWLEPLPQSVDRPGNDIRTTSAGSMEIDPRAAWCWPWLMLLVSVVGFSIVLSPFLAPRHTLLAQVPLAFMAITTLRPSRWRRPVLIGTVLGSALLSLVLFDVDRRWAATYPEAVSRIQARWTQTPVTIYFLGHWGWQYYAERQGWRAWDERWLLPPLGGRWILAVPTRADAHPRRIPAAVWKHLEQIEHSMIPPHPLGLTTCCQEASIAFHSGGFGQLPWGRSWRPTEVLTVHASEPTK